MAGIRVKRNWSPSSGLLRIKSGDKHNVFHPCPRKTAGQKNNIPQHCCKCAPTKRRPTSHPLHRRQRQVRLSRPHRHQNCRNPNRQCSIQQHNLNQRWPIHVYCPQLFFYLGTPINCYKYTWIKMANIPQYIIDQYGLTAKAVNGKVLVEIRKGMYVLKQASRIATNDSNNTSKPLGTCHVDTHPGYLLTLAARYPSPFASTTLV